MAAPAPARRRAASDADVRRDPEPRVDRSRLSEFARLLERITGRQIELVPPFTYLVSAPPAPEPEPERDVELVVPPDFAVDQHGSEPLVVDISAVLRRGTADRMVLHRGQDGGFALLPPLDLAI